MIPGEIWFGLFPFGGRAGAKVRPALIVSEPLGSIPEFIVALISSSIPPQLETSDVILDPAQNEHACTNLSRESVLRLHKITTVHRRDLLRKLGDLPTSLRVSVSSILRSVISI